MEGCNPTITEDLSTDVADAAEDEQELPAGKRHCGEYSLLMHNAPATLDPAKITDFFLPIVIKNCIRISRFSGRAQWKVVFMTAPDMNLALEEKQWQYVKLGEGDDEDVENDDNNDDEYVDDEDEYVEDEHVKECCIRLSLSSDCEKHDWKSIHRDLQMDIFSHFDARDRGRHRRVCKEWSETLKPLWDAEVNRCLYLNFWPIVREPPGAGISTILYYKRGGRMFRQVVRRTSATSCGRIKRLVIKYANKVEYCPSYYFTGFELKCDFRLDEYLLEHSHYDTVIIIGLTFEDIEISKEMFRFEKGARWPRKMKVIFHKCGLRISPKFATQARDVHRDVWTYTERGYKDLLFLEEDDLRYFFLPVKNFVLEIDAETTQKERFLRVHLEMDKQIRLRTPPEQLEALKCFLGGIPLDDDTVKLAELNGRGRYTVRQALRRYFEGGDITRKMWIGWEPTGLFFERYQLTWRDCFVLSNLTERWHMLKVESKVWYKLYRSPCFYNIESRKKDMPVKFQPQAHKTFLKKAAQLQYDKTGHCFLTE